MAFSNTTLLPRFIFPGAESWKISFEEHVVTHPSQTVQVSLSCFMACLLSDHLKRAESTSTVRVADWQQDEISKVLCAVCRPHMHRCMCCWWYAALFSTFPPLFLFFNVSVNFQRKRKSWRNIALCEEVEAWHYVTFSQSLCRFAGRAERCFGAPCSWLFVLLQYSTTDHQCC